MATATDPDKRNSGTTSGLRLLLAMRRNGILLALCAALTTALIAFTQLGTGERIERQRELARSAAMRELLQQVHYDNDLLADSFIAPAALSSDAPTPVAAWRARAGDRVVAVLLQTIAPDGYTGEIELLVGILSDGSLAGVRTVKHRETPGLGDKIELAKSPWILSFNGLSLGNPPPQQWTVRRKGGYFDQFTGATITPVAVIRAVRKSLEYVEDRHHELFQTGTAATKRLRSQSDTAQKRPTGISSKRAHNRR